MDLQSTLLIVGSLVFAVAVVWETRAESRD